MAQALSAAVLGTWVRAARTQVAGGNSELARENQQLRTALARVEQERDILKKALPTFFTPMGR